MRVVMFQPRFAKLVGSGDKTQTIRRKARCKPGDQLSLREWTGLPYRSKQRELREPAPCTNVQPIRLDLADGRLRITVSGRVRMFPDDVARADGFSCAAEMREWFDDTHGLPFEGDLIEWV